MHAVTVEPLHSMFFVAGAPGANGWSVEEDVEIEIANNIGLWSDGAPLPDQVLCRSLRSRNVFKIYKYEREVDLAEYEPTGLEFGGVFSRASWERFAERLPAEVASFTLGGLD